MPYNFAAENFHTKKLVADFLRVKPFLYGKRKTITFWGRLCGLEATYAVHLRLMGKLVGDFRLLIIELFFARCFHFVIIHAFERRTDGQMLVRIPRLHSCSAVKMNQAAIDLLPISGGEQYGDISCMEDVMQRECHECAGSYCRLALDDSTFHRHCLNPCCRLTFAVSYTHLTLPTIYSV